MWVEWTDRPVVWHSRQRDVGILAIDDKLDIRDGYRGRLGKHGSCRKHELTGSPWMLRRLVLEPLADSVMAIVITRCYIQNREPDHRRRIPTAEAVIFSDATGSGLT